MRIHLMLITVIIKPRFFSKDEIEKAYEYQQRERSYNRMKDQALRKFLYVNTFNVVKPRFCFTTF